MSIALRCVFLVNILFFPMNSYASDVLFKGLCKDGVEEIQSEKLAHTVITDISKGYTPQQIQSLNNVIARKASNGADNLSSKVLLELIDLHKAEKSAHEGSPYLAQCKQFQSEKKKCIKKLFGRATCKDRVDAEQKEFESDKKHSCALSTLLKPAANKVNQYDRLMLSIPPKKLMDYYLKDTSSVDQYAGKGCYIAENGRVRGQCDLVTKTHYLDKIFAKGTARFVCEPSTVSSTLDVVSKHAMLRENPDNLLLEAKKAKGLRFGYLNKSGNNNNQYEFEGALALKKIPGLKGDTLLNPFISWSYFNDQSNLADSSKETRRC